MAPPSANTDESRRMLGLLVALGLAVTACYTRGSEPRGNQPHWLWVRLPFPGGFLYQCRADPLVRTRPPGRVNHRRPTP
jgi:hypothetical protein